MVQKKKVYIWDMDGTLILLKSLINGTYAEAFKGAKDVQKGTEIGKMWENYILQVCDDYFFYEQIENSNKPFLDSLIQYDDGQDLADYDFGEDGFGALSDDINKRKLAYRHRAIADKYKKVYIWDMDETLILLKSLINGTYAEAFKGAKDVQKGIEIGKTWENYILQVCDDYFFYEQIENSNKPSLDSLIQYDDGQDLADYDFGEDGFGSFSDDINKRKLAYRHRAIADKYKKGLRNVLDEEMLKELDSLYSMTDSYTDRWFSSARACLEQCSDENKSTTADGVALSNATFQHVNVLVTSGSLIPSLVKCLLFQLDDLIPEGNVYSSWEVGKLQCFSLIKERFGGPNVQFCVIGDGWEECAAAQTMKWPFVQVDPRPNSPHRFPGLNFRTLGHYISVVYGNTDEESDSGTKEQLPPAAIYEQ